MNQFLGNPSEQYESLYVHVPFCAGKCEYCAFYSKGESTGEERRAFRHRLDAELREAQPRLQNLHTLFIGGGTPSVLAEPELTDLLGSLHRHAAWRPGAELTMECNPESLDADKIAAMAKFGINRASVGIQSFSDRLRQVLGRGGNLDRLPDWLACLKDHGIDNLGADLIYGIPGQTLADWEQDLELAFDLGIRHLSTYELTWDEGSKLARRGHLEPVCPDLAVFMWRLTAEVGGPRGFVRYEVSNLARPGFECRHNQGVWHGAPYLGCGPAACSFDGRERWSNPADLQKWLRRKPAEPDELSAEARAAEILAFGMRTLEGWNCDQFKQRTGFDLWHLRGSQLAALAEQGLIAIGDETVRPTEEGFLFADYIAEQLL